MKIVVDGMGGDNAPVEILKGCALAVKEYGVEIIVTGDEAQIKKAAEDNSIDMTNITVEPADGVITMEDNPLSLRTEKKNSSLGKAFQLLKSGEADALVGGQQRRSHCRRNDNRGQNKRHKPSRICCGISRGGRIYDAS